MYNGRLAPKLFLLLVALPGISSMLDKDFDREGTSYSILDDVPNPTSCAFRCMIDTRCTAWSFAADNSPKCMLKSGPVGLRVPKVNYYSGLVIRHKIERTGPGPKSSFGKGQDAADRYLHLPNSLIQRSLLSQFLLSQQD